MGTPAFLHIHVTVPVICVSGLDGGGGRGVIRKLGIFHLKQGRGRQGGTFSKFITNTYLHVSLEEYFSLNLLGVFLVSAGNVQV